MNKYLKAAAYLTGVPAAILLLYGLITNSTGPIEILAIIIYSIIIIMLTAIRVAESFYN